MLSGIRDTVGAVDLSGMGTPGSLTSNNFSLALAGKKEIMQLNNFIMHTCFLSTLGNSVLCTRQSYR